MAGAMNSDSASTSVRRTLLDKIWEDHIVAELEDGTFLLHVDRHLVHEMTSYRAFDGVRRRGIRVRNPELTFAVIDHIVATSLDRGEGTNPAGRPFIEMWRRNCSESGITHFDIDDPRQGIVHVIGPELGIVLPGSTVVCGDSHTASNGAVGALAWGIGTSEVEHVLATQTIMQRKPKSMRLWCDGRLGPEISAKDVILYVIGKLGTAAGRGYVIEYGGPVITALSIEERLTVCNMSIELGARAGFVAPDERTFDYLAGSDFGPKGQNWDKAVRQWQTLRSEEGATFDTEVVIECAQIKPQITWGTSPQDVIAIDERLPDPAAETDSARRAAIERSLRYIGLAPGDTLAGTPIDYAFIGSCTNGRYSDLVAAAEIVRGRKVARGVRALVVPGSTRVKLAAERAGLDKVFIKAGFEWRTAGCSMCVAGNGDVVPPGKRCMSTSNRNFEGRQGPGSRTHLASPASVAAAAVSGAIVDVRTLTM